METGKCEQCGTEGLLFKVPVHDARKPLTQTKGQDGVITIHTSYFMTVLWCAGCRKKYGIHEGSLIQADPTEFACNAQDIVL